MVALELLAAFVLIVGGAIGFTNAVEWLGQRLNLGASAVGAILAAVGTALPESIIPVVALLSGGGEEAVQIAVGAIIGAPFLLGTAAMLLIAVSALAFRGRREHDHHVQVDTAATRRDLALFLLAMPCGVLLGVLDTTTPVRLAGAGLLVAAYAVYTARTVTASEDAGGEEELEDLFFDPSKHDPPTALQIVAQFVVSLAAIIGGAELFVRGVETIAESLGIAPLIIALVLAPLATELPEKANSILWLRDGKDVLAVGNITGAMAFQSTIPIALGLLLTDWRLDHAAVAAALVGIAGGAIAMWALPRRRLGVGPSLAWAGLLVGFVAFVTVA